MTLEEFELLHQKAAQKLHDLLLEYGMHCVENRQSAASRARHAVHDQMDIIMDIQNEKARLLRR